MKSPTRQKRSILLMTVGSILVFACGCSSRPAEMTIAADETSQAAGAATTGLPSTIPSTTSTVATTPETSPAIELVNAVFVTSKFERAVYDDTSKLTLFTEVTNAFASQDLPWANDTISLELLSKPIEGDASAVNDYLAFVITQDGVAHASVAEIQTAGYFREGIDTGQEGHSCIFWDQCPPGVEYTDYEYRTLTEIVVTDFDHSLDGCVFPTASGIRIIQCS